jgi:hypothetical protein
VISKTQTTYMGPCIGLRQGDPLSHLLFNLVVDVLPIMLKRARDAGLIKGLIPELVEGGLTHLQYSNDIVIFIEINRQSIANVKFFVYCFENMSGLKISYHKSEIFVFGSTMGES